MKELIHGERFGMAFVSLDLRKNLINVIFFITRLFRLAIRVKFSRDVIEFGSRSDPKFSTA